MTEQETYDKFFADEEYDLEKCTVVAYSYWSGWNSALKRASRIVHDEIRPQGEWIDVKNIPYLANCSNCGYQMDTHEEHGYFSYCPYCGADMGGKTR